MHAILSLLLLLQVQLALFGLLPQSACFVYHLLLVSVMLFFSKCLLVSNGCHASTWSCSTVCSSLQVKIIRCFAWWKLSSVASPYNIVCSAPWSWLLVLLLYLLLVLLACFWIFVAYGCCNPWLLLIAVLVRWSRWDSKLCCCWLVFLQVYCVTALCSLVLLCLQKLVLGFSTLS